MNKGVPGATVPLTISRLLLRARIDDQILPTLLFRSWSVVGGAVTVIALPLWLTPTQQGYYYTFGSMLALQVFFELGLSQIVMQLVSHEVAHLSFDASGHLQGDAKRLGRLSSLARLVRQWYAVASVGFLVVGGVAGIVFFSHQGTLPLYDWLGSWGLVIAATAANLMLSPRLAMMEGCGQLGAVARLRLMQSIVGYVGLWAALGVGAGLWAVASIPVASAICTALWLRNNGSVLSWLMQRPGDPTAAVRWLDDVLPLQWRIAVSWMSGYFVLSVVTPFVFAHRGAVEAGQYGMGLTIFAAVSSIGMSWVSAKSPAFTMHISRGERTALNTLFRDVALRSTVATAVLSFMVFAVAWGLTALGVPAMQRVASPGVLFFLAIITAANGTTFAMAVYMRAHREEPMLPLSVATGLLTVVAVYYGSGVSLLAMSALQALVVVLVPLPWAAWRFRGYYRRVA